MARSRTVLKKVSSITPAEYSTLVRMNMQAAGSMQSRIKTDYHYGAPDDRQVVIHYREDGKIDGWAYVFNGYRNNTTAWFYVSPKARRKGVGTKLANRVKKIDKKIVTQPWDKRGAKFFQKNGLLDKNKSWMLN